MRRLLPVLLCLAAAACRQPSDLVTRPAEGYRALRVTETQFLAFRLGGIELQAGTVYVQDRLLRDGTPLFCPVGVGEGEFGACVTWDGSRMVMMANGLHPTDPIPVRPGSVEEFRLR